MKTGIIHALVAAALLCAGHSHAAPPEPDNLKAGEAKAMAGDCSGALADLAKVDSPEAARFIGLCEDKLGHVSAAVAAYERFLGAPPPKLAGDVGAVFKRVEEIKATPGKLHVETLPAGAHVVIDGASQLAAAPLDVRLAPGKHLIHVTAPGRVPLEREVLVGFASAQEVSMQLSEAEAPPPPSPAPPPPAPAAPPPPAPPPTPSVTRTTVAIIAACVSVVGAGVATAFGILALQNKSDYQTNPTYANADNGNNDAAYADAGIALAVAAGVTSIVLFATRPTPDGTTARSAGTRSFSAAPIVTPHGGGAGALLRF